MTNSMKLFVNTIVNYIKNDVAKDANQEGIWRYILPGYPPEVLLEIGEQVSEFLLLKYGSAARLEYGIAYGLGLKWNSDARIMAVFNDIKARGWYNQDNNLTELRNKPKPEGVSKMVVILAGYEEIEDRDSLKDFVHLENENIWKLAMKKSFQSWLKSKIMPEDCIDKLDAVFSWIYENYHSDLYDISCFMEECDFDNCLNADAVYERVVENLSDKWRMPRLLGALKRVNSPKKTFGYYASEGIKFFRYETYKKASERKKLLDKIEKIQNEVRGNIEEPEEWERGCYDDINSLLEDLKKYIEENNQYAANKLLTVDFPYLHDKILQKRIKSDPKPKNTEKRLRGLPPEVFWRALLITISEFMNRYYPKAEAIPDGLKITIVSKTFNYNSYEGIDNDDTDETSAQQFLTRVLGGIDGYIKGQLDDITHNDFTEVKLEYNDENKFVIDGKKRNKIPYLGFVVRVELGNKYIEQKYGWEIPENHPSVLLHELKEILLREYSKKNELMLPLVGVPYIKEIFRAKGEESVIRILRQGLHKSVIFKDLKLDSRISSLVDGLMRQYYSFWDKVDNEGIFAALKTEFDGLRKEYEDAARRCLEKVRDGNQAFQVLIKAFLITDIDAVKESDMEWKRNLEASVVTPLHPSLLELLHNQYTYFARAFSYIFRHKKDPKTWQREWARIVDLAGLRRPLFAMIGEGNNLKTNIESFEYVHLLGTVKGQSDFIDAKLLLEYDTDEDDEIAEAEIFEQSQTSLLLKDLLKRYLDHYPYARDGMTITVYCGSRIQSIIAGLDEFLKEILNEGPDVKPFALQLTLLSDAESDNEIMSWVNAWKDIWYQNEAGGSRSYYSNCDITVKFRVVSRDNTAEELKDLLKNNPSDIVILCDVVDDEDSEIQLTELADFDDYIRFPILEKVICSREHYPRSKRQRIVSNQRFSLPLRHAEMLWVSFTGQDNFPPNKTSMVLASSNIQRLSKVIAAAHNSGNWVICLDESIDKNLLLDIDTENQDEAATGKKIEIVGFGTGVGSHGELNYTVSTTRYRMNTISEKLVTEIEKILGHLGISEEEKRKMADVLIRAADEITGMSLVRITGVERFVREFIGSAMVRSMLTKDDRAFCDEVVCLDDFPHWFNFDTNDNRRPDLLRLRVNLEGGYLNIDAQLIECKVGQEDEGHIEKARKQINNGLQHLMSLFVPRANEETAGINLNVPPDRRYWWMQLHRVIASKSHVGIGQNPDQVIRALERLSEGYFNIRWQAAAFLYLTNTNGTNPVVDENKEDWKFRFNIPELGECQLQTLLVKIPRDFIAAHCLGAENTGFSDPFQGADSIEIRCAKDKGSAPEKRPSNGADEKSEADDLSQELGNEQADFGGSTYVREHHYEGEPSDEDEEKELTTSDTAKVTVVSNYPERVFLGIQPNTGKKIYWEYGHKELSNRHLLVFGASGQGKTYAIQAILWELAKGGQNSVIIDYTDGFTNKQLDPVTKESLKPKQLYVKKQPLPVNIFRSQTYFIDDVEFTDKPFEVAQRVSGVFSAVYNLGEQQKGVLYDAIKQGVETKGLTFTLNDLVEILEDIRDKGGPRSNPAVTIVNKIKPFVDTQPFGPEDPESWEKIYSDTDNRCHIIQLTGYNSKEITRLITEFALLDFYRYYRLYGNVSNPRVIVLDEAQNLDHSLESPIGQMLTEGRKFGISLILATQTLSNLSKDEKDRLFQAKHKLFFRPADTELGTFAKIIADSLNQETDKWVHQLAALKKGECYSLGPALDEATGNLVENACIKIKITSLEDRKAGI